VIGLRPDDDINDRRTPRNLRALGLRDTAGDRDHHVAAAPGLCILQPSEIGVKFLRRLFPNVTGVQDDEVGVSGRGDRAISDRREEPGHPLAVVDVHLAAIGLDENAAHRPSGGFRRRLSGLRLVERHNFVSHNLRFACKTERLYATRQRRRQAKGEPIRAGGPRNHVTRAHIDWRQDCVQFQPARGSRR